MNTSTQISIYNMALSAVGVSRSVQSITEGSQQANTCNIFWDAVRDQVLQDFPWGFAMRYADLQLTSKTIPGWLYVFTYPSDCLQARLVLPQPPGTLTEDDFYVPGYQGIFADNFWYYWRNPNRRIPFAVVENEAGGGLGIATNVATPVLAYTARIKTIVLWSPAFVNALTWLLASKIVAPLAANSKYAETAGKAYEAAILKAGALSMNEGVEKPETESEFILARL